MVHLTVVPDDRRARAREARRRRVLDAASRVIDRDGLDGLTMQAVADELDCAVGTLYTSVASKAELVAALQADAVEVLRASHRTARERWDGALADDDLAPEVVALVQLQAYGAFLCAAAVVFADEVALQRRLLSRRPPGTSPDDLRRPLPLVERVAEAPRGLVRTAVVVGALDPGDELERVVRWLAALHGVLLLDRLAPADAHLFRAQHHGRALTADLLVGWGASRPEVEVAASHVERLAALGPLAPPPEGPGFDGR